MSTHAEFAPDKNDIPKLPISLLSTTPVSVAKVLKQLHPMVRLANKILALVTWTDCDPYESILLVISWCLLVNYFELIILSLAPVIFAICMTAMVTYMQTDTTGANASLDEIVHEMADLSSKIQLCVFPFFAVKLSGREMTSFIFATVFTAPLYMFVAHMFLTPKRLCLIGGVLVLTWHSTWCRVIRSILWRWKPIRVVLFYFTGLDFNAFRIRLPTKSKSGQELQPSGYFTQDDKNPEKQVRFTYVLYENQRRWLGIGWTPNMLIYERAPWTDEFLNESAAPESFQLPDTEGTGMEWRWIDKTWKVDLTSDGALVLKTKLAVTPDPGDDEGFVYYDNMWKSPSAEYSYLKFTRRRRWIRTAELVTLADQSFASTRPDSSFTTDSNEPSESSLRKVKINSEIIEVIEPSINGGLESTIQTEHDGSTSTELPDSKTNLRTRKKSSLASELDE